MQNKFTLFKVGDCEAKAYHSLDNLYRIENSGTNLNQIYFDILDDAVQGKTYALSFGDCQKILNSALEADLSDFKERSKFIRCYLEHYRAMASNKVIDFIVEALKMPGDNSEAEEKKTVASPL